MKSRMKGDFHVRFCGNVGWNSSAWPDRAYPKLARSVLWEKATNLFVTVNKMAEPTRRNLLSGAGFKLLF